MPKKASIEKKCKKVKGTGLFEIISDLGFDKKNLIKQDGMLDAEVLKQYVPYMVNRAMSYHLSSIMDAALINQCAHLDKDMQHDYYLHALRKEKRFSKWHKTLKTEELELVAEEYGVNLQRATEYLSILTEEQLAKIKERNYQGGVQNDRAKQQ